MKIVSSEQMRRLEAAAISTGLTEESLQQRAGASVAEEVVRLLEPGDSVVVLSGRGNNGRDGAVAALRLARRGVNVQLFLVPRHTVRSDELDALRAFGTRVKVAAPTAELDVALRQARVVVDALVGIGAYGPLREPAAAVVRELNRVSDARSGALKVVSVDLPSGVDADSGAVTGDAVWADVTVTLGAIKSGLLRFPAANHVGELVPRDIGLPDEPLEQLAFGQLEADQLAATVPVRPLNAHKYAFGRVLIVAGSDQFLGAPALCAGGALRIGAGLATVASTDAVRSVVAAHTPEATFTPVPVDPVRDLAGAIATIEPYLFSHDCLVVGPGLGRSEQTQRFVREILRRRASSGGTASAVLDADALFVLASWPEWWKQVGENLVLTPHAGELARLAGGKTDDDQAPWERAGELASRWGCTLVAKGPFTAVATPDGSADVWCAANPALASGGTGDVLAGMCGGLLAQSLEGAPAARLAVAIHAQAAQALVDRGQRTLLASDLLTQVPLQLGLLAGSRRRATAAP